MRLVLKRTVCYADDAECLVPEGAKDVAEGERRILLADDLAKQIASGERSYRFRWKCGHVYTDEVSPILWRFNRNPR